MGRRFSPGTDSVRCVDAAGARDAGRRPRARPVPFGEVGAINVERVGAPNLALVSLEQVSCWRRDWIVATDPSFVAQLDRHPVWPRLPAVRARRVLLIPRRPFGWFDGPPALNRLLGIEWLSAVFHPQRVHYRLDERLAATFEWLYRRRPSIGQMCALLATTR